MNHHHCHKHHDLLLIFHSEGFQVKRIDEEWPNKSSTFSSVLYFSSYFWESSFSCDLWARHPTSSLPSQALSLIRV